MPPIWPGLGLSWPGWRLVGNEWPEPGTDPLSSFSSLQGQSSAFSMRLLCVSHTLDCYTACANGRRESGCAVWAG